MTKRNKTAAPAPAAPAGQPADKASTTEPAPRFRHEASLRITPSDTAPPDVAAVGKLMVDLMSFMLSISDGEEDFYANLMMLGVSSVAVQQMDSALFDNQRLRAHQTLAAFVTKFVVGTRGFLSADALELGRRSATFDGSTLTLRVTI